MVGEEGREGRETEQMYHDEVYKWSPGRHRVYTCIHVHVCEYIHVVYGCRVYMCMCLYACNVCVYTCSVYMYISPYLTMCIVYVQYMV